MRLFFSLALIGLFASFSAQETLTYPYNPDGNDDGAIASPDLLDILGVYGGDFSPSEIQIDGVGLLQVIQDLQNQIGALQGQMADVNFIESTVVALQEEVENQQAYISDLEQYISINDETVLISGANLQVVSGEGSTDADVNGTGNIIIGYNEDNTSDKSGSHNLVVGYGHTYSSYGGIVVGYGNSITGDYSSVSGGASNTASGQYSSVSGGLSNTAEGVWSSVLGGYGNTASGANSSVSGSVSNTFLGSSSENKMIGFDCGNGDICWY